MQVCDTVPFLATRGPDWPQHNIQSTGEVSHTGQKHTAFNPVN